MEKAPAGKKSDPNKDAYKAQHSEDSDEKDKELGQTKTIMELGASNEKESPELTLVLIGDINSIEIGPENILIDHDNKSEEQFLSRLYDMCGRHISVINMLGVKNIDKILLNQEIHAFLLLLPCGLHNEHYSTGIQRLEKALGKRFLSYIMIVVTYEPGEKCESALADLKTKSCFADKRCHKCIKSMTDEKEVIALLEKIDIMVFENIPPCYSRLMSDEDEEGQENLSQKTFKEVTDQIDSSASYQNPKGIFNMGNSGNRDKQSVNISEENIDKEECQTEIERLLIRLNLQDKYQKKMSRADFLKIGPPVIQSHDTLETELAHAFLQRFMMLDYRARYIPIRQDRAAVSHSKPVQLSDCCNTDDNDFDTLFSSSIDLNESKEAHVHPMDVQMAVFHCSNSFLKQILVTKLSQCQYALPLLVPDPVTMDIECPLWTFRQITRTWKKTSLSISVKSMPICKAETLMVLFFRLGSSSVSKSELMNTLINDRHSTFFNRNSPGSTKTCHLMDGVAEIAWYCPAGKPNDFFTDCIALCNLHGDAMSFVKQREILLEKSSVNVVLVQTLEKGKKSATIIKDLYSSPKPLIILMADDVCGAVQMKNGKYKIGVKDRSQSDVSEELKGIIGEILSGPYTSFKLESMAKVSGVTVDEDEMICQKGKSAAEKILSMLQGMEISKIKDKFLPCQGDLWHEWCRINKEMHHLKGHTEMEKSKKEQQMMKIRQDQCRVSHSKVIKSFAISLFSLSSKEKEYFLKWIQILIDALSTDDLSSIFQSYDEKWTEVLNLKKKHDKSDLLTESQAELEQISKRLQSATFGLEHIFREMGQIYEAHRAVKAESRHTDWAKYPELAAELMISGQPVELMDGDAGHVPLTWISSLLDEVIKKLGDQRVFVLSVLGLQSSGKSTMLNAMFGMQFAVSAGRCTKGAYMQLVKVSEEIKKDFKFSYVLVVDTEGLRALELAGNDTLHHDNELATFVVGLGNMTLINIFGENPAEMQDVLQIVVQAFMRMKKVNLSPSCVFVHQNVTDISAAEKNMDGKRRLQEKLDQMAQLAAKEELCDAECFSDVIGFDVQKDVKYFAQLWEGSPPMAPPNPGYSESVQEMKNIILSKAKQSAGINLSYFKRKIDDLWKALMNEQFVFSFKNTLEIAVYRKLEVQYGNWTWALRSNMIIIENLLHTRIENGELYSVERKYLFNAMSKKYEEVQKDMSKYFDDDRDKEMLIQWRGRFENKIKEFQEELVGGVEKKLKEVIQQKKACKKLDDKKPEFENKLLQKSKELAHQLKDKAKDEEELKEQFDTVWSDWVKELTADTKPIEDIELENDQLLIFLEIGFEWPLINESKSSGKYKRISEGGDYSDYIFFNKHQDTAGQGKIKKAVKIFKDGVQKIVYKIKHVFQYEDQDMIRTLINTTEQQSLEAIKSKPVATRGYSSTYLLEVAKTVQKTVKGFESNKTYSFKKEFTVDLLLYIFNIAGSWLSQSHKIFTMNNDAHTYLVSKKTQYYNIFRSFCKGNSSAVVFGEMICEKLKVSIVEAVFNKTAIDLAGEMRCTLPAFSGNRMNLEKHLLKSLADKEDFLAFITYIRIPRKQVKAFIEEKVNTYIFRENKDKALDILRENVDDIHDFVCKALFDATKNVKIQSGNIEMWVKEFSSFNKDKLSLDAISCQNFRDINNFDFLKEEIERRLASIKEEVSQLSLDKVKEFRLRPDQILIDQLCNCCWETCPFCGAVCTNTIKDHSPEDHSVPFHRSSAVCGWHPRNTVEMSVEFCTTKVTSDKRFYPNHDSEESIPYKMYKIAGKPYKHWRITPDESKLKYWKWFVHQFQKELEDYYNLRFEGYGEIPTEWKTHTKEEAIQSLNEML